MSLGLGRRRQERVKNSVVQPLVHTRGSVSSFATRSCFRATNVREWCSGFFHSFQSPFFNKLLGLFGRQLEVDQLATESAGLPKAEGNAHEHPNAAPFLGGPAQVQPEQ